MKVEVSLSVQLVLTALFVTLKVLGIINWSWLWILSPIWITILATFIIFLVVIAIKKYYENINQ